MKPGDVPAASWSTFQPRPRTKAKAMTIGGEIQEQQRQTWDRFPGGWTKWDDMVLTWLRPAGDEIIRSLKLGDDGEHLDVAAGTGEPGLSIGARLPRGRVVL